MNLREAHVRARGNLRQISAMLAFCLRVHTGTVGHIFWCVREHCVAVSVVVVVAVPYYKLDWRHGYARSVVGRADLPLVRWTNAPTAARCLPRVQGAAQ